MKKLCVLLALVLCTGCLTEDLQKAREALKAAQDAAAALKADLDQKEIEAADLEARVTALLAIESRSAEQERELGQLRGELRLAESSVTNLRGQVASSGVALKKKVETLEDERDKLREQIKNFTEGATKATEDLPYGGLIGIALGVVGNLGLGFLGKNGKETA